MVFKIDYRRSKVWQTTPILLTFIKLLIVIKIVVLSVFEWPFYTGFIGKQFMVNISTVINVT